MLKKVYITHGYTANSTKHWFPWLKLRLKNQGFWVEVFDMPNSTQPDAQQWLEFHQQKIQNIDSNSYFIAHSLGCIATLRFLQQRQQTIGGVILVAGFAQSLPNLPELDQFSAEPLDFAALIQQIPQRLVIASDDDQVVNVQYSRNLAQQLQADYLELSGYGHFLDRQGISELPLVYDNIMAMINPHN